ncbi:AAA family ATPase [Pseudomonas sp. TE3610]
MAKKQPVLEIVALTADGAPRPRLHKLIIQNFRSIGNTPVEIELDDIVVLVGANNAGKSSILRAYEIVMSHGSKDGQLSIHDFPNGVVDREKQPTIELQTVVFNNAPGERWLHPMANGEYLIRER